jgi:hypothetical protein
MSNIVTVEANAILTSSVTGATYAHAVTPVNLALTTTNGDATTKGTEVTGGSYARVTTASGWATATGGSITNSGTFSFTNMPSCTIVGIELWDSATRAPSDFVTTTSSANISSATAAFTSADVGQLITGTGVTGGTTIASVTDATHAVMSAAITGSGGTGVTLTIATPVRRWFGSMTSKVVNSGDTVTFAASSISITLS